MIEFDHTWMILQIIVGLAALPVKNVLRGGVQWYPLHLRLNNELFAIICVIVLCILKRVLHGFHHHQCCRIRPCTEHICQRLMVVLLALTPLRAEWVRN